MTRLTIYSKPGCHLCDEMKDVIARVAARLPDGTLELHEVDISTDAALEAEFGRQIPVLFVDGRQAAAFRISEEDLQRRLRA